MTEQQSGPYSEASLPPRLPSPSRPQRRPKGRPAFGFVVAAGIGLRFGREIAERVAVVHFGPLGFFAVVALGLTVMLLWRGRDRLRVRRQGGAETSASDVVDQIAASGLGPPAFPEDGTLLGASVLAVNQRTKLLEVNTEYEVFGSSGQSLGGTRQIGQSTGKQVARVLTAFDQFFTHHFEIVDAYGRPVLRLTRPRKLFLTKLHVFDGWNRYIGSIVQMNVFWKIRFQMRAWNGQVVGHLRAKNLRAWDFDIYDWHERVVASVVKSWEGWARTTFTRADRYTVRIHEPLASPLRELTVAAALAADLALKQDQRGL